MMTLQKPGFTRSVGAAPMQRAVARRMVCKAQQQDEEISLLKKAISVPLASAVAAALLVGAVMPEDAMAASRSGGRVGGASGFSARRAAPPRSVQTQAAPSVSSTTVVVAPPMYSPFGFSPFGGFGFGFGMPMYTPFPFFGSIISFMFLALVLSVVFNVLKGFVGKSGGNNKKDDGWGDL